MLQSSGNRALSGSLKVALRSRSMTGLPRFARNDDAIVVSLFPGLTIPLAEVFSGT